MSRFYFRDFIILIFILNEIINHIPLHAVIENVLDRNELLNNGNKKENKNCPINGIGTLDLSQHATL